MSDLASSAQSAFSTGLDAVEQAISRALDAVGNDQSNSYPNLGNPSGDVYPEPPITVEPNGQPTPTTSGSSNDPGSTNEPSSTDYAGDPGWSDWSEPDFAGPVVLDLTGNGINIAKLNSSNTFIDATGDGLKNRTAWAGAGSAVLFFDPNDTNAITQANQVLFKDWDPTAATDMEALLDVFDTNHNGKLDAGDENFSKFKLMVTNADGTQTAISLSDAGIASIDLSANNVHRTLSDGSSIDGETTYTRTDGSTGIAATVSFAYDSRGHVVRTTTSTDGVTGAVTLDNKAFNRDGSLANETISVTSADGSSKTTSFDLNGDGQIDVVQTDNTVTSGGVTTETLTDSTLAGVLIDRTVTTTSINATTGVKTVTIDRDSNGSVVGGVDVVSQREVDVTTGGLTAVSIQDLNPDGSVRDQVVTTPSAGGLTSTVQRDFNGDGAFDLTTITATTVDATTGALTTVVSDNNANGSERDQTTTVASADGQWKTTSSDLNGDGVVDLTTASTITQGTTSSVVTGITGATTTIVQTAANGALVSEAVRFESNDGLVKVVQMDMSGAGTSAAPVFDRTTTDITTVNASTGERTRTVTDTNADGSLLDQSVTIIGSDGITRTTKLDTTGSVDGSGASVFDRIETVNVGAGGSIVDTASSYAMNGTLIARSVTTTSADGLSRTVRLDRNGDGTTDLTTASATTATAGGGTTVTMTDLAGNGSVIDTVVKTTSADGLVTTTHSNVGGNVLVATDTTSVDAATGTRTETVTVTSANGSVESNVVTVTSVDRNTQTISSDINGDGHVDRVETVVKQSDGSIVDTVSSYASNGTRIGQVVATTSATGLSRTTTSNIDGEIDSTTTDVTTLNADGSRTETVTLSSNNGTQISQFVSTVSATGLSKTATSNIDGKIDGTTGVVTTLNSDGGRTETITKFDSTGARISSTTATTSANGLSIMALADEDGDGATDVTKTDVVVLNADGSRTETVTTTNANGSLRDHSVNSTSANGLSQTVYSDTNGDAAVDRIMSQTTQANGNVVKSVKILNQDGSLVGSMVTTTSADGLSQTTQSDVNGDGVFDKAYADVISLNADGSKTETVSTRVGTMIVGTTATTTSADGRSKTSTVTTNGVLQETDTSVVVYNADGSQTQTVTVKSGNGATQKVTVTTTSADRKTTTVQSNTYGAAPVSSTRTTVIQPDGSIIDTVTDFNAAGAKVARIVTTTSANGLSTTTSSDQNGDGTVDEIESDVRTIGVDGSRTEIFTDTGSDLHSTTGGYRESATVVTTTSANGLSRTVTTTGTNGQGSLNHVAVQATVINADGSQTTTNTDTVGTAADVAVTTIDRTGLTVTKQLSTLGNGTYDRTDVRTAHLDGSTTETITNLNADGSTSRSETINISADGRTRTITDNTVEHGVGNDASTTITPIANGDSIRVTINSTTSGVLLNRTTTTSSADGLSTTVTMDADGDGATDDARTDFTGLNADGSRTETVTRTDSSGARIEREITTTSADGLVVTSSIAGNGAIAEMISSVKTNNSDGSTTNVTTREAVLGTDAIGMPIDIVLSRTVVNTSADGRTTTATYDLDGNGTTDEIKTSQTVASGVTTLTDAYYDSHGATVAQTITTTSADGRQVTIARNSPSKPTVNTLETTLISADGSGSYSWTQQNSTGAYLITADHLVDSNGVDTVSLTVNGTETTYRIAKAQEADDLAEVQRIYRVVLGRDATAVEGQTWLSYTTPSGLNTTQLANDLLRSAGLEDTQISHSGGPGGGRRIIQFDVYRRRERVCRRAIRPRIKK